MAANTSKKGTETPRRESTPPGTVRISAAEAAKATSWSGPAPRPKPTFPNNPAAKRKQEQQLSPEGQRQRRRRNQSEDEEVIEMGIEHSPESLHISPEKVKRVPDPNAVASFTFAEIK